MDGLQLLAVAGTVAGLVGIAGGSAGYFKSKRGDAIIAYQARELELRDGTIARLEKDNTALSAKCDSQAETIAVLKPLSQGSPQLEVLNANMEKNNALLERLLKRRAPATPRKRSTKS